MGMWVSTVDNYIPSKINILQVSERVHSLAPPPILKVRILKVKEIHERASALLTRSSLLSFPPLPLVVGDWVTCLDGGVLG